MIASPREENQRKTIDWKALSTYIQTSFLHSFVKGILLGILILILGGYGAFRLAYYQKILPGVVVAGVDVSGRTADEALFTMNEQLDAYLSDYEEVAMTHGNDRWSMPFSILGVDLHTAQLKDNLLMVGRRGSLVQQLADQYQLIFGEGVSMPAPLVIDETLLSDLVATAAATIDNPAIPPRVYVGQEYNPATQSYVVVEIGSPGEVVDQEKTTLAIKEALGNFVDPTVTLKADYRAIEATENQLKKAEERAEVLADSSLTLFFADEIAKDKRTWKLQGKDLVSFLSVTDGYDGQKISEYIDSVASSVNRPAQNALFQFDASRNVVESFKPAKKGLAVQTDTLAMAIKNALDTVIAGEDPGEVEVWVSETDPQIDTASVNDLGIETLLGKGESTYYNSSAARKHNVEFAAQKFNGILVAPGETFSFNAILGEVSVQTGFQQALIIRDGRTLLGDGGGVCQDSTTLFRAVLDAGLPITAWQNHSFRVGYYEQNSKPGFDATVYLPAPDFKFVNDTPGHILIQTKVDNMKLTYELYGTDDGRVAEVSNYTQWDFAPPPPELHQDDPTLPAGVVKQVESAVPGLKTKFDYTVTRNGEVIFEKTFLSVFKPWRAIYLHGTGGV